MTFDIALPLTFEIDMSLTFDIDMPFIESGTRDHALLNNIGLRDASAPKKGFLLTHSFKERIKLSITFEDITMKITINIARIANAV